MNGTQAWPASPTSATPRATRDVPAAAGNGRPATSLPPARPGGARARTIIRPVRPADLAALTRFFERLSAQSRYLRFFGPIATPSASLLDLLSGRPSHVDAVVATAGGVIVGHAMAADRTDSCGTMLTDIGVVVADAWQGRGVGATLVRTLMTRAQARGVASVVMDVMHGNHRVLAMITAHWPGARVDYSRDFTTINLRLPQQPRPYGPPAIPLPASGLVIGP